MDDVRQQQRNKQGDNSCDNTHSGQLFLLLDRRLLGRLQHNPTIRRQGTVNTVYLSSYDKDHGNYYCFGCLGYTTMRLLV